MKLQGLDQVIQQNASVSEEMAATSTELASQAEQLQDSMSFFNTNDGKEQKRLDKKLSSQSQQPLHTTTVKKNTKAQIVLHKQPKGDHNHYQEDSNLLDDYHQPSTASGDEKDAEFERF